MSLLRLDLDLYDSQATVDAQLLQAKGGRQLILDQVAEYLDRLVNGSSNLNSGRLVTGAVKATGTITFSSLAAADTVTINGVVFTARVSPSGANEFALGANDTAAAANLAAKINASPLAGIANVVTATSALGVVTLQCVVPGLVGNAVTIAISAHGSVSGSGRLTSGAEASITSIPA